ncbi:hypothetical protein ACQ4PT_032607 [Festuca glaucescens]
MEFSLGHIYHHLLHCANPIIERFIASIIFMVLLSLENSAAFPKAATSGLMFIHPEDIQNQASTPDLPSAEAFLERYAAARAGEVHCLELARCELEMDESRSGVCEVEKVPGIEVHGEESDNSSTGLGDESLSASENIFVDSRSYNSMSSEHVREANINMDIDNDNERNISEVAFEENNNEVHGV